MTTFCTRAQLATAAVLVGLLVLAGCAAGAPDEAAGDAPAEDPSVTTIATGEAVQLLDDDDAIVLIDVRTPEEFGEGHVAGAELLDLAGGEFEDRIGDYDRDDTYVLYCRTGSRSAEAALLMEELGFTDVRDAGAYDDLATAGAPTAS